MVERGEQHDAPPEAAMSAYSSMGEAYVQALAPPSRLGCLGQLEGYDIVEVVGAGGMGVVFRGLDEQTSCVVAIKTLRPELADRADACRRFAREAGHMREMRHPNIVPVLSVGQHRGMPYLVMPFMVGGCLRDQIDREDGLPLDQALRIAAQVGEALSFAHGHAVIHRDLKPSNVLLDDSGVAYLADFGLVRGFYDEAMIDPRAGSRAGTPAYMSPKTAAGEPEAVSGDIYSFGAMLYEMLTGRPPYTGETAQSIIDQIVAAPPAPIAQLKSDLPRPVQRVVEGAMARELRDRYAEVSDVLADLRRLESGLDPLGPHGQASHTQPPAKARGRIVAASLGIALSAGLGALWIAQASTSDADAAPLKLVPIDVPLQAPEGTRLCDGRFADLDGDGIDEYLLAGTKAIDAHNLASGTSETYPLDFPDGSKLHIRAAVDTNGDRREEVVVASQSPQEARLSWITSQGKEVRTFRLDSSLYTTDEGYSETTVVDYCNSADVDGDGAWELIASYTDGYANGDRGIACFDVDTQRLLWKHSVAPSPIRAVFDFVDGDDTRDVVVGTYSHATGKVAQDGTRDSVAYLYGLKHDGTLLWRHDVNAIYAAAFPLHEDIAQHYIATEPNLLDLDGNGRDDLVVVIRGATHWRPEIGSVHLISAATGKPSYSYMVGSVIIDYLAVDLDRDGKQELLLSDRLGRIHVLDHRLQPKRVIDFAPPTHDVSLLRFAGNLPAADGSPRLVIYGMHTQNISVTNERTDGGARNVKHQHDIRVVLTDASLAPLASYQVAQTWTQSPGMAVHLIDRGIDGDPSIMVVTDTAYVLQIEREP